MPDPLFRLKPDVVIEPLVAGWHANTLLVAPWSLALITARRHLPMLASWLADPATHALAIDDPDLLGGPFMDIAASRTDEVQAFADWTRRTLAPSLALAQAIEHTWALLASQAQGQGLSPLYDALPPAIKGLAELVYTPAGAPDVRLLEALLYQSEYYNPGLQQTLVRRIQSDQRSFSMSTPRLPEPGQLVVNRPFRDPAYDVLARARHIPTPLPDLLDAFGLADADANQILPWLDSVDTLGTTPPAPSCTAPLQASRWRYFGHACVLVEAANGTTILVDPVIACESGQAPERYTLSDLPPHIDYLLITHNHPDHALIETLLALRWKTRTVLVPTSSGSLADPSLKAALQALGFNDVRAMDSLESVSTDGIHLQAIPFLGEHADLDIRSKTSWLVDTGDMRLLFAADSNNLAPELYTRLQPLLGRLNALFLGMECQGAPMSWLYGSMLARPPLFEHDQSRRLDGSDAERAWALVKALDVDEVLVYAMGMEPWLTFICGIDGTRDSVALQQSRVFIQRCIDHGIAARRLYGSDCSDATAGGKAPATTTPAQAPDDQVITLTL